MEMQRSVEERAPVGNVPGEATAVVLLADHESSGSLLECVKELKRASDLPFVVLVGADRSGADGSDPKAMLEWQRKLYNEGVDDLILKRGDPAELRLVLLMSVNQAQLWRETKARFEAKAQDYEKMLERAAQETSREDNCMFWECVDRIFSKFPQLDQRVTSHVEIGAQIGGCELEYYIGHGAFGSVYAARNLDGGPDQAVKVLSKDKLDTTKEVGAVWRELRLLQRMEHPHVVQLYGAVHGPRHIFIHMELAGGRNLYRVLKSLGGFCEVDQAQQVNLQLLSAVAHCHERGVGHRDIKPENIAVSDDGIQITLLDFGRAVQLGKFCFERTGTMPFMAPEVMAASPSMPYSAAPADVWSCGMVLFEMLCGISTFDKILQWIGVPGTPREARSREIYSFLTSRPFAFVEVLHQVHPEIWDTDLDELIDAMFQADPAQRLSAQQAVESLAVRRNPDRCD